MPLSPLEVLKKGLALLSKRIQARKKDLNERLARQKRIQAGESSNLTETSDKEIFDAVMEGIAAQETSGINGCDDVNDEEPVVPLPTRQEVLQAISTITKYVDVIDDPIARKIDSLLLSAFN